MSIQLKMCPGSKAAVQFQASGLPGLPGASSGPGERREILLDDLRHCKYESPVHDASRTLSRLEFHENSQKLKD